MHAMSTSSPNDHDLPRLHVIPPGLYRHYKGGWYEVIDTVRCSETLQGMTVYRALYDGFGLWVRSTAMFSEFSCFQGRAQPRFERHDPTSVPLDDLATAQALIAHLRGLALRHGFEIDTVLRSPPPEPNTCCGRGCNGCVWEGYFTALQQWREDTCELLPMTGEL